MDDAVVDDDVAPEARYARASDGVTVAYRVVGSGPVLVWLPSLSDVAAQWRVPALREAYRRLGGAVTLVLYDGRGTGASDRRVAGGLGLEPHVRDLEAVVDTVAGEADPGGPRAPVALLGYYHSVPTALAYAARWPERVSRLVMFGGTPRLRDSMRPSETQALLSLVEQDWDLFADTAARTWLGWEVPAQHARRVAEVFRGATTPAVARDWFAAAESIDVTELLPRVRARTLVLHRQSDRQIPREVSRRFADALPDGHLVELPGTTPTLFMENPREDIELVTRFVVGGDVVVRRTGDAEAARAPTPREREVLGLLAAGETNAGIGRALGITEHTVERHVANVYRKIGARGRADATAWALRHGVV